MMGLAANTEIGSEVVEKDGPKIVEEVYGNGDVDEVVNGDHTIWIVSHGLSVGVDEVDGFHGGWMAWVDDY
jgi:hypothetical protein